MRDLRDPTALGEALIAAWEGAKARTTPYFTLVAAYESHQPEMNGVPDYAANLTPHEKYGDPRTLPSTMP